MIYDAAIIGTGPAGISAALNLKIHNKNFLWIGSKNLSDKITKAEKIANYPGFFDISGEELNQAFSSQIEKMGIEIQEQMVNSIMPFDDHFALLAGSAFYEAKTVLLTTGITMKNVLKNESELLGKGVSYCATCDGALYKNKTIAVICNHPRFEHEVKYLSDLASVVHYFPLYRGETLISDSVIVHREKILGILGEDRATGIETKESKLDVDGVFILRDQIALSALLSDLETEDGHIRINRSMETNISGVYAAGDCTGRPYQYAKAVGEGNIAAHSMIEYLAELESKKKV